MAQTEVQICNTSLARIGVSNFISSLSESSQEAIVCNVLYTQTRDRLLREMPWPFARTFQSLALVSESGESVWNAEWDYVYRYPTDALTVRKILTPSGRRELRAEPYEIGSGSAGRLIYTNAKDAGIEYTRRIEDPTQFDSMFLSCFAWLLAAELAMPLAVSDNIRKQALQMFQMERDMALRVAFNESEQIHDLDTEFVVSRGYTSSGSTTNDWSNIFPSGISIT
jgi:hypothetical protein